MNLPVAKPFLIAIIAMIAIIGVSAGVLLGNQTSQSNAIQPVENQSQEQLNDSQMIDNLNKTPDELADNQKGYQGNEDINSERSTLELTKVLKHVAKAKPVAKSKVKAKAKKPKQTVKPKPPANNNNNGQAEEDWDPLENPGVNPDVDEGDNGEDGGDEQSGDSLI